MTCTSPRFRRRSGRAVAATCLLSACLVVATAVAQSPQTRGRTYASLAELPDWSGAWVVPFPAFLEENARQRLVGDPISPPLTPAFAAVPAPGRGSAARQATNNERCLPSGMPNVMRYAFAIEFLFTPGRVTILLENDSTIRRVYTDGRGHDPEADPSYTGESIGRWEGDTLVVSTVAISPRAELMAGVPTSGRAHVTERIHLKDATHLQIDSVVEDPVALTMPWRRTRVYERSGPRFYERVCDNNRDREIGDPDLTPPR